MASNRYRANRSLGNKINNINARLGDTEKSTSDPHVSRGNIISDYLAADAVTTSAMATRATTEFQVERGSIGTEHLGIINQIVTDSGVVFRGTPGSLVVAVQASEGQTANIMEWQDSLGYAIAGVTADGSIFANDITANSVVTEYLDAQYFGGDFMQISQLDDISYMFDGIENRFPITYQGEPYFVGNPFRLLIYIDGILQTIYTEEYTWQSPYPKKVDVFVDSDGYLAFASIPPVGATFSGRILTGQETTTQTTNYPYRPTDLLLGA